MPKTKSQRERRKSLESAESVPVPNDASHRPPAKKAQNATPHCSQRKNTQAMPTVEPSAPGEAGFQQVSSWISRRQSGKDRRSGKSNPVDLNPRRHGVQPVLLNTPSAKTRKVSRSKAVAASIAQGQGHVITKCTASPSVDRQAFMARRVKLWGQLGLSGTVWVSCHHFQLVPVFHLAPWGITMPWSRWYCRAGHS